MSVDQEQLDCFLPKILLKGRDTVRKGKLNPDRAEGKPSQMVFSLIRCPQVRQWGSSTKTPQSQAAQALVLVGRSEESPKTLAHSSRQG